MEIKTQKLNIIYLKLWNASKRYLRVKFTDNHKFQKQIIKISEVSSTIKK